MDENKSGEGAKDLCENPICNLCDGHDSTCDKSVPRPLDDNEPKECNKLAYAIIPINQPIIVDDGFYCKYCGYEVEAVIVLGIKPGWVHKSNGRHINLSNPRKPTLKMWMEAEDVNAKTPERMTEEASEGRPFVAVRKDCEGNVWYIPAFRLPDGKVELSYGRFSKRSGAVNELRKGFGYKDFGKKED